MIKDKLTGEKQTGLLTWIAHAHMGDTKGKMSNFQGGLEFRLKYLLSRGRGGGM